MALDGINLRRETAASGVNSYRYDTTDTLSTVEATGYFTREASQTSYNDIYVDFNVGDQVTVYVWTTTIITGTFIELKTYTISVVSGAGVATIVQSDTGSRYSPGGTVIQGSGSGKATAVTLSELAGTIQVDDASLAAAAEATFTVTNTLVEATDVVVICAASGQTGATTAIPIVTAVAAGSFDITIMNLHGSTADTGDLIINYCVMKINNA